MLTDVKIANSKGIYKQLEFGKTFSFVKGTFFSRIVVPIPYFVVPLFAQSCFSLSPSILLLTLEICCFVNLILKIFLLKKVLNVFIKGWLCDSLVQFGYSKVHYFISHEAKDLLFSLILSGNFNIFQLEPFCFITSMDAGRDQI